MWEVPFPFVFVDFTSTCRDSLFVIQKAKLLHMNTVVNIAPRGLYFHGKVIGMLVVFLGKKILILVFLGSSPVKRTKHFTEQHLTFVECKIFDYLVEPCSVRLITIKLFTEQC